MSLADIAMIAVAAIAIINLIFDRIQELHHKSLNIEVIHEHCDNEDHDDAVKYRKLRDLHDEGKTELFIMPFDSDSELDEIVSGDHLDEFLGELLLKESISIQSHDE